MKDAGYGFKAQSNTIPMSNYLIKLWLDGTNSQINSTFH